MSRELLKIKRSRASSLLRSVACTFGGGLQPASLHQNRVGASLSRELLKIKRSRGKLAPTECWLHVWRRSAARIAASKPCRSELARELLKIKRSRASSLLRSVACTFGGGLRPASLHQSRVGASLSRELLKIKRSRGKLAPTGQSPVATPRAGSLIHSLHEPA